MHAEGFGGSKPANRWGSLGAGTPRKPLGGRGVIGAIVAGWPELPEAIKAGMVAMAKAASGSQPDRGTKAIGCEEGEV